MPENNEYDGFEKEAVSVAKDWNSEVDRLEDALREVQAPLDALEDLRQAAQQLDDDDGILSDIIDCELPILNIDNREVAKVSIPGEHDDLPEEDEDEPDEARLNAPPETV